jgi:hypothetical protein
MSKTKTVALADVLWTAANTYLSPVYIPLGIKDDRYEFSCHAFNRALHGGADDLNCGNDFLDDLGLSFFYSDCDTWRGHKEGGLQGVRYMWLLLAMHVAEDEGVMVEVPQ